MTSSTATVRNNPTTRKALIMALIGFGLLAYVVAGWMPSAPEIPSATVESAAIEFERATHLPSGGMAAGAMAVGFVLLLAACAVLLQAVPDRSLNALHDALTGLYSRIYAAEALPGLAARDDREGRSRMVLVRLQIEAIGELDRRYGSAAVELVTRMVGHHIRSQTREDDLPVAPDQRGFAIFLHCEELEQARTFCRRLGTLVRSEQLDWQGDVIKVSVRMTITARRLGESIAALERRADGGLELAEPGHEAGMPA